MRGIILSAALGVAALSGCYTSGTVGYSAGYSGSAYVSTPDLVTVSPGVQVVADYDEPVFYTDGFYWRFYNNGWYRSDNYSTGWYYYERPPVAVLRIDRPYAYVRYRPHGYVARNRGRYRPAAPIVRDHRSYRPEPVIRERRDTYRAAPVVRQPPPARQPSAAPAPAPVVRDHRAPPPAARRDRDRDREEPRVRDHRNRN